MESGSDRRALYRRTLLVVVFAQILAGAGLSAGITVGALLAEDMLGGTGFSGIPIALFAIGSASSALLIGIVRPDPLVSGRALDDSDDEPAPTTQHWPSGTGCWPSCCCPW